MCAQRTSLVWQAKVVADCDALEAFKEFVIAADCIRGGPADSHLLWVRLATHLFKDARDTKTLKAPWTTCRF
jgi:hypothetical protein